MRGIKEGDVYIPSSGSVRGGFTVIDVAKDEITVEVERQLTTKDGELKTEKRKRVVTPDVLPFFLLGYRKDNANG